jgi:hypothetical protein
MQKNKMSILQRWNKKPTMMIMKFNNNILIILYIHFENHLSLVEKWDVVH